MTLVKVDTWRNNMRQGVIFTQDKVEIEVYFLTDQVPPELDWQLGHQVGDGSKENPYVVDEETGRALVEEDYSQCHYSGPKGEVGEAGINDDDTIYSVILDTVKRFEDTQLNIASESAQEVLAMVIEKKVKALLNYKGNLD